MNRECIEITFEMNCLNTLLRYIDNKSNQDISIDYKSTRQAASYIFQTKGKRTVFPGYWMFRPGKYFPVQSQQLKKYKKKRNMFKDNNKDNRKTSMKSFWYLYC